MVEFAGMIEYLRRMIMGKVASIIEFNRSTIVEIVRTSEQNKVRTIQHNVFKPNSD